MDLATLTKRLRAVLGTDSVYLDRASLAAYEYDAGFGRRVPDVVVLPRTTAEVQAVVRIANEAGVPIVARGAGTGLCNGAVPLRGGIVVSLTRMNRILEVDYRNRFALVEPGVINLELSEHTLPRGYYYAPDPSSQKISTIGGNVATNAGGPHCLAYGVTSNHVLELEAVLPNGEVIHTGGTDCSGYDLTGLLVGSEGTLGIVTKIGVRLTHVPESLRTSLAGFATIADASNAVSSVIAAGIVPAALEMMDKVICRALEAAYHVGLPPEAGAVLLTEVDGPEEGIDETQETIAKILRDHGASDLRLAASAAERAALWAARKGAAGAMGRLAPNYYIQDGVVPRTRLPEVMARVEQVSAWSGIEIANVFHAGDGNLHPGLLFDRRFPDQIERTFKAGDEILRACVEFGGAISGEHGIGFEKREQMTYVFNSTDLAAMAGLRQSFDPTLLFNPDKLLPASAQCAEISDLRSNAVPVG
jgi:glycolate dehydrogenase FAD-linked subunit